LDVFSIGSSQWLWANVARRNAFDDRWFYARGVVSVIAISEFWWRCCCLPSSGAKAARRSQCKEQSQELAIGFLNHHERRSIFQPVGWGYQWVGESGPRFWEGSTGGWVYNILPFIEETAASQSRFGRFARCRHSGSNGWRAQCVWLRQSTSSVATSAAVDPYPADG